jgi:hypothetical protein
VLLVEAKIATFNGKEQQQEQPEKGTTVVSFK